MAVVLCHPIGYEAMATYRTYRHLAERLAAAGFAALRFDYDGTGNSSGESRDPGRMAAWVASVGAAIDEVIARSGARQAGVVGVRLGATLAMLAAAQRSDVACLVPWAPVVSGHALVREIRAFRLARVDRSTSARPNDGSATVKGHFFSSETLDELATIDLASLRGRPEQRVLLLPRGDAPSREEAELADMLRAGGARVRVAAKTGYAKMVRDDPYEAIVPVPTLDAIVEWFAEALAPRRDRPTGFSGACEPAESAEAPPPAPPRTMVVASTGGRYAVHEAPLTFGDGLRLYGIYTAPEGRAHDRPVLCFLNAGATHNVGPHRMYVELARDFASRGYPAFRFDVAGLGDSEAPPGEPENRLYAKSSVSDVRSAMAMLAREREARRFVLVGLCAGAYLAYHAAVEAPEVAGQVLINPFAFEMEGRSLAPVALKPVISNRAYARALRDRRVWLRAARGEVDLPRAARVLRERVRERANVELVRVRARVLGRGAPQTEVERQFRAMCDRGVASLLVASFEEGGLDMIARYLGDDAERMRGRKNFALHVVEGADHTFGTEASSQALRTILSEYLEAHFP